MKKIRVNLLGLVLISFFAVSCQAQRSEITYAIKHGDLDTVKELIAADKGLLFTKETYHSVSRISLLHFAILYRQHDVLEYLLKEFTTNNIDIDKLLDSEGRNPLFFAIDDADPTSLRLLIQSDADLMLKNKDGNSALGEALFGHGSTEAVIECFNILLKEGLHDNFSNDTLDFIAKYRESEIMTTAKRGMSLVGKGRYLSYRITDKILSILESIL